MRSGLSYRNVEEPLAERGIDGDHVTIYRWVQRFTPLVIDAARPCHTVSTIDGLSMRPNVKVAEVWRYAYLGGRSVRPGHRCLGVEATQRRCCQGFFEMMLVGGERPKEVTTDLAAPLVPVVDELLPEMLHDTTQYSNNPIECDHGRLKARLRPMRGLRTDRT